ncbi:MAG: NUDIX domain-containing protein [Actinobacteria bacterium]|uniref:Unannotated protein n=1 Tax=freshwater metagenome TaxID=449393 RepID=A0A6J5YR92_9ZZZZ|nr:NUDIX domain-containing protein [Actinomycetota bacterium]
MIADEPIDLELTKREEIFRGRVWDVRRDEVNYFGVPMVRDYVVHPGAVGVIAINDKADLLLVSQYRHPMGKNMWEPPAGLLDTVEESPLVAAKRELLEETGYEATTWNVLVDFANSPGGSTEQIRCYLAQGLKEHASGRPMGNDEELHMLVEWVPLESVIAGIRTGLVTNSLLVAGTFALLTSLADPEMLRDADASWPARDFAISADRVRLPE